MFLAPSPARRELKLAKVLSLFSGCGGFDSGFIGNGFEIVAAFDKNPAAVSTYNKNFVPVCKLMDLATEDVFAGPVDVVIGGPPCQGFSTLGMRKADDPRNNLFIRACQIAVSQQPKVIVLENVPGITHGTYAPIFDQALKTLTEAGFCVQTSIVSSEHHGLAQRRKRLFLVATSDNRPFEIALPRKPEKVLSSVLRDIISDDSELGEFETSSKHRQISEAIGQGQKLSNIRNGANSVHTWNIPEAFGKTSPRDRLVLEAMITLRRKARVRTFGEADPVAMHRISSQVGFDAEDEVKRLVALNYLKAVGDLYDLRYTFNGKFRRLSNSDLSPTVDTHFGDPRLFLHPTRHRGITSAEAAAIQGFPATFSWPNSKKDRFRLVGNAVPPPVSSVVAEFVRGLLR